VTSIELIKAKYGNPRVIIMYWIHSSLSGDDDVIIHHEHFQSKLKNEIKRETRSEK